MIESYTERLVLSNKMFNIGAACLDKLNKMEDSYTRLLKAAKELRNLDNAAEVARLLKVSDQAIQNWKTRGVPNGKLVEIQGKIGASPKWISTGAGSMTAEPGVGELNERQKALLTIMSQLDDKTLDAWMTIGKLLFIRNVDRRVANNGHSPERRLDHKNYGDAYDMKKSTYHEKEKPMRPPKRKDQ
jgi:hypothetical protein